MWGPVRRERERAPGSSRESNGKLDRDTGTLGSEYGQSIQINTPRSIYHHIEDSEWTASYRKTICRERGRERSVLHSYARYVSAQLSSGRPEM